MGPAWTVLGWGSLVPLTFPVKGIHDKACEAADPQPTLKWALPVEWMTDYLPLCPPGHFSLAPQHWEAVVEDIRLTRNRKLCWLMFILYLYLVFHSRLSRAGSLSHSWKRNCPSASSRRSCHSSLSMSHRNQPSFTAGLGSWRDPSIHDTSDNDSGSSFISAQHP